MFPNHGMCHLVANAMAPIIPEIIRMSYGKRPLAFQPRALYHVVATDRRQAVFKTLTHYSHMNVINSTLTQ